MKHDVTLLKSQPLIFLFYIIQSQKEPLYYEPLSKNIYFFYSQILEKIYVISDLTDAAW